MLNLRSFRKKVTTLPHLLNYATLCADGVILNKDGSLTAGWYFVGDDLESATAVETDKAAALFNKALGGLHHGWMMNIDSLRIPAQDYPGSHLSHFPDRVSAGIDQERRQQHTTEGNHYENARVLLLTYLPPTNQERGVKDMMFEEGEGDKAARRRNTTENIINRFEQEIQAIEDRLTLVLNLTRLRGIPDTDEWGNEYVRDLLLEYLHFCLTGTRQPVKLPPCPMFLDALIGGLDYIHGTEPKVGHKFVKTITLGGLPQESYAGMLDALDMVTVEYRWATRFIMMDAHEARRQFEAKRRHWRMKVRGFKDQIFQTENGPVNLDAQEMVAESERAIADVESGLVTFGKYTSTIVLMDESIERVTEEARILSKLLETLGFTGRIETINATEAWLGSLPAHAHFNPRKVDLHSLNLAHLLPLHGVWTGTNYAPCPMYPPDSPALLHGHTHGATPFRFNLHIGDVGHTAIIGPTGSGKSTFLALIAAQFRRYDNATVVVIDKGNSMKVLTKAMAATSDRQNGVPAHYEIGADDSLQFCPLQEVSNDAEQAWAASWIETLLSLQGLKVTPAHRNAIHDALSLLRHAESRTLTDFVTNLQDLELREALTHYTLDGPLGRLLDHVHDELTTSDFMCFEIEDLMNMQEKAVIPVLLYLFHRIEKQLKGQPALLILDEAWLMLGHPVFREKIREWLKVMRKANCAVVMATQSISDAQGSGMMDVINESCLTKVFLPNEMALTENLYPFYQSLGLNARQIDIIASATRKQDYYYTSPEGSRLFSLGLGELALAFVGAGDKESLARQTDYERRFGGDWVHHWLAARQLNLEDIRHVQAA